MSDKEKFQKYIEIIDACAQDLNTNPGNVALRILGGDGVQNPLNRRAALKVRITELIQQNPHPKKII